MEISKSELSRRRKTSVIWNYFTPIDHRDAFCNECQKKVSYKSTITNLKKHLACKHGDIEISAEINKNFSQKITEDFENVGVEYEIENNAVENEDLEVMQISPKKFMVAKKIPKVNNTIKTPSLLSHKKIKLNQSNNKSEMIQEAINILSSVPDTEGVPENDEDDDELAQFGKYLISQLRQLPQVNALQLQEKFQSLLFRERINMLKATETKSCFQQHLCACQHHQCPCLSSHNQHSEQNQRLLSAEQSQCLSNVERVCISSQTDSQSPEPELEIPTSDVDTNPKISFLPNVR